MKFRPAQTLLALAGVGIAVAGLSTSSASAAPRTVPASAQHQAVTQHAASTVTPGYVADYETYTVGSNVAVRSCTHAASCPTPLYYVGASGSAVDIKCWKAGDSVNGDTTWYYLTWMGHAEPFGYMTGYYTYTGADPNPQIRPC